MKNRLGLSMAELVVAISVIAMAVGPLIALLSSSNQMSNHSIYEEMSVHYCREITDQLLRFSPKIPIIVDAARKATGNSMLTFGDLVNDKGFNLSLMNKDAEGNFVELQNFGKTTGYRISVSKMDEVFHKRKIRAVLLDSSSNKHFKTGRFWKIVVTVGWRPSPNDPEKDTQAVIIIGDYS